MSAALTDGAKPTLLVVACALIDPDNRILVTQRPQDKSMAGLWEFPGGKVNQLERVEEALIRELAEELTIQVTADCLAPLTFASHSYREFHLLMPLFICRRWDGVVQGNEGQRIKWDFARKLREYPMPPADTPLIAHLIDLVGS